MLNLLFDICQSFVIFLLGALIIYLLSIMFAGGVESFEKKHLENSQELQSQWREESRAKEEEYYRNRGY